MKREFRKRDSFGKDVREQFVPIYERCFLLLIASWVLLFFFVAFIITDTPQTRQQVRNQPTDQFHMGLSNQHFLSSYEKPVTEPRYKGYLRKALIAVLFVSLVALFFIQPLNSVVRHAINISEP